MAGSRQVCRFTDFFRGFLFGDSKSEVPKFKMNFFFISCLQVYCIEGGLVFVGSQLASSVSLHTCVCSCQQFVSYRFTNVWEFVGQSPG